MRECQSGSRLKSGAKGAGGCAADMHGDSVPSAASSPPLPCNTQTLWPSAPHQARHVLGAIQRARPGDRAIQLGHILGCRCKWRRQPCGCRMHGGEIRQEAHGCVRLVHIVGCMGRAGCWKGDDRWAKQSCRRGQVAELTNASSKCTSRVLALLWPCSYLQLTRGGKRGSACARPLLRAPQHCKSHAHGPLTREGGVQHVLDVPQRPVLHLVHVRQAVHPPILNLQRTFRAVTRVRAPAACGQHHFSLGLSWGRIRHRTLASCDNRAVLCYADTAVACLHEHVVPRL